MDERIDMIDPRKRPPSNRWRRDQRIVLCLLRRFYHTDKTAFKIVFNAIFEKQIRECGFPSGMPYTSLSAQWANMHRDGHAVWWEVHVQTPFERSGVWSNILQQIESTANSLDISLQKKEEDDIDTSRFFLRRNIAPATPTDLASDNQSAVTLPDDQRPEHPGSEDSGSESTAESSTAESLTPEELTMDTRSNFGRTRACAGRPCRLCHEEKVSKNAQGNVMSRSPGLVAMPIMSAMNEFTGPNVPSILYRWSNVDSMGVNSRQHLVAGLFASDMKLRSPEEYSQERFREFVQNHVKIQHVPSPFISTFVTPLPPIHRALNKREGAMITIIDTSQLQSPLYSARLLVSSLGLRDGWYCGVGEYLIWGRVPSQAIVASFKISDLEQIAAEDRAIGDIIQVNEIQSYKSCGEPLRNSLARGPGKLDHSSGLTVGRLLRRLTVPQSHSEAVAKNITCSWRFGQAGGWDEFRDGLRAAYALPEHSPHLDSLWTTEGATDSTVDDDITVDAEE